MVLTSTIINRSLLCREDTTLIRSVDVKKAVAVDLACQKVLAITVISDPLDR